MTIASSYKAPPAFNSTIKPYSRWIEEIKAWRSLTDLDKKKQGLAVALSLDEKDLSGIRDKVLHLQKIYLFLVSASSFVLYIHVGIYIYRYIYDDICFCEISSRFR